MRWSAVLLAIGMLAFSQPILQQLWTTPTYPLIPLSLALNVKGGIALVGGTPLGAGTLYVFSPNGALLTSLFYVSGMRGVASSGSYTVAADNNQLIVMNNNGIILNVIKSDVEYVGRVAIDQQRGVVVTCNVNCAAYSLKSGKELWHTTLNGLASDSPVIIDGYVYVPDAANAKVWILSEATGSVEGQLKYSNPVVGISACREYLAVLTPKKLYVYEVEHPNEPKLEKVVNLKEYSYTVAISPDCKYVAVGGHNLEIYTLEGKEVSKVNFGTRIEKVRWVGNRIAVLFNQNGNTYASVFKVAEASLSAYGTPTTRYVLNFSILKNVKLARALTYPSPNGTVFLYAITKDGKREILTLKNNEVVGAFVLPKNVMPIYDTRMGEYATYKDKLLIVINDTIYGVYGSKAYKVARLKGAHALGLIKVGDKIYGVDIYSKKVDNSTVVYCKYYDALNNMKLVRSFSFDLGKNVTAYNVVVDGLDAKGCAVLWQKRMDPNIYYWYKGAEGEAKGEINPFKENLLSFSLMMLEVGKGTTEPFLIYVTPGKGPKEPFIMKIYNPITKERDQVSLPGPFSFAGAGDFLGKGYVGQIALLIRDLKGNIQILVISPNGEHESYEVGKLSESTALLSGLVYHKGAWKNVIGVGNFTGALVDVKTNIGTLKFEVRGLTVAPSSLGVLISLSKSQLCYTAIINPELRNVVTGQASPTSGSVYVASSCVPR